MAHSAVYTVQYTVLHSCTLRTVRNRAARRVSPPWFSPPTPAHTRPGAHSTVATSEGIQQETGGKTRRRDIPRSQSSTPFRCGPPPTLHRARTASSCIACQLQPPQNGCPTKPRTPAVTWTSIHAPAPARNRLAPWPNLDLPRLGQRGVALHNSPIVQHDLRRTLAPVAKSRSLQPGRKPLPGICGRTGRSVAAATLVCIGCAAGW